MTHGGNAMSAQIAVSTRSRHLVLRAAATDSRFSRSHLGFLIRLGFVALLLLAQIGAASAALAPPLGTNSTFAVVSSTYSNTVGAPNATTITGNLCYTTAPAVQPVLTGAESVPCNAQQGLDETSAQANMNAQLCTAIGAAVALDTVTIPGQAGPGIFPPGCYSSTGSMTTTGAATVTLNGNGVYIFRTTGGISTGAFSTFSLTNGACASDVYWSATAATTLGASTTFVGTIIDAAGITLEFPASLTGRALAFPQTVTTVEQDTITVPSCGTSGAASLNGTAITYATQAVVSASTRLTASQAIVAESGVIASAPSTNSTLTFTLPGGANFATTPSTTCTVIPSANGSCSITSSSNPVGMNAYAVTINYAITGSSTITFQLTPGWSFTNASALSSPQTPPLNISLSTADTNFAPISPVTVPFAGSASALLFTSQAPTTPGFGTLVIDVGAGGLGKQFIQAGGADTTRADLGGLILGTVAGPVAADGITQFSFGSATINLAGNFSGIATAYLGPFTAPASTTTCAATAPSGSSPGTIGVASIGFANVAVPATNNTAEVCLFAGGTSLIAPNSVAPVLTAVTGTAPAQSAAAQNLDAYNYNGSVQQILYSGSFPNYRMYIRVVNDSGAPATVVAAVQTEAGSTGSTVFAIVPANTNVLVPTSTIIASSGVSLDATGRVSLLFLTRGAICNDNNLGPSCPVSVSQLLLNPNGTVVQLGSGAAP